MAGCLCPQSQHDLPARGPSKLLACHLMMLQQALSTPGVCARKELCLHWLHVSGPGHVLEVRVGQSASSGSHASKHTCMQVVIWVMMDMPQPVHALPLWTAVAALRCLKLWLGTWMSKLRLRVRLRQRFVNACCLCSCSSSAGQVSAPQSRWLCSKKLDSEALSASLMSVSAQLGGLQVSV